MKKLGIGVLAVMLAIGGAGCRAATLMSAAAGAGAGMLIADDDVAGAAIGGAIGAAGEILIRELMENHEPRRDNYRYSWDEIRQRINREYDYLYNLSVPYNFEQEQYQRHIVTKSIKRIGDRLLGDGDGKYEENEVRDSLYAFRVEMKDRAQGNLERYIEANKEKTLIQMLTGRYQDIFEDYL